MAMATEAALQGEQLLWGAPTFDQCRIGWGEMYQAAGGVADFRLGRMEVTFPTGGKVIFRSLDNPDNARGHTADGIIMDEAPLVKQVAWYEVLRPIISDTNGWAVLAGTPKGRNWFWREMQIARDDSASAAWITPTLGVAIEEGQLVRKPHPMENPSFPFAEAVRLWNTLPERIFRQEFLAEFLESEGAVFRNISACMKALLSTTSGIHREHRVVAGVDWGKHEDFTAISIGCADCQVELARDRFNRIDYVFQRARLLELCQRWGVENVLAESNAMGEPIIEQLQREGLPVEGFQTTASSKPPLIENLALTLERGEWQFQDDPIWTGELEAYERQVSLATGRSAYAAPAGMHDDTVIARALMVWHARHSKKHRARVY